MGDVQSLLFSHLPSHLPRLFSLVQARLRPARLDRSGDTAVTREGRWYFQLPAHRPIFIIHRNLCSGPVCGRLGVTASPHLEATWPSVQFRQLTKLWPYQGFVNRTERIRVTSERWQATLTRPYRPHSPREGPHQRCLRPVTERNRQDHGSSTSVCETIVRDEQNRLTTLSVELSSHKLKCRTIVSQTQKIISQTKV